MAVTARPSSPRGRGLGASLDDQFLGNVYDAAVVRRLMGYAMRYPSTFAVAVLGIVGYICAVVAQPLIIAWGIDGFIAPGEGETRSGNLTLVVIVFLLDTALLGISQYIQFRALARVTGEQHAGDAPQDAPEDQHNQDHDRVKIQGVAHDLRLERVPDGELNGAGNRDGQHRRQGCDLRAHQHDGQG